jgi:hypothetical protein
MSDSIPAACLDISDIQFVKASEGSCTASLSLASANPANCFRYLDGDDTLVITAPEETPKVFIYFKLQDPAHVIVGLAFEPNQSGELAGRREFPGISITRNQTLTTLGVEDEYMSVTGEGSSFPFVIVIQQVSTGDIGIIDPLIRNEP